MRLYLHAFNRTSRDKLSVIIYGYSLHFRERAPLELEGSFCHKKFSVKLHSTPAWHGLLFKTRRDRAETISFRWDKIRRLPPMCVKYCNLFFFTVFKIGSYVIYLVRFSAIEYTFKRSLWNRTLLWNVFFTDNRSFILLYKRKTALSVKRSSGLSTEMIRFSFQRESFNCAIICYPCLIQQSVLNTLNIYHFDI